MEKDIFKFGDFLSDERFDSLKRMKSELLKEGLLSEEEEINQDFNPYSTPTDTEEEKEGETGLYSLYKDKAEEFICDIAIEGVSERDAEVRLVIESNDWNIMFKGKIEDGKCIIPIKKLSILSEGQTGDIRLEVNADGNLFTPWEDKFIVKVDKKVTVKMNESKHSAKKGVKVKIRR